jgi:hypothetical protein
MKVRTEEKKHEYELTKEFNRMSKTAQNQLNECYRRDVERGIDLHFAKLQKNWLMLCCIVLNRAFKFGRKRSLLFLGNWREIYRINSEIEADAEQQAWLKGEMDRIFGKNNYPYDYIDKLEEM